MSIKIENVGRRYYLVGDTFAIRSEIKSAGCKWDPDRKAWWTGKLETAESLVRDAAKGALRVECSWRKVGDDFLVAVPAGAGSTGSRVTVRASSGATKEVTLAAEVQPGLFAVVAEPKKANSGGSYRFSSGGGRCRGCRGPIVSAPHCRAMGGYCGSCAYDEF